LGEELQNEKGRKWGLPARHIDGRWGISVKPVNYPHAIAACKLLRGWSRLFLQPLGFAEFDGEKSRHEELLAQRLENWGGSWSNEKLVSARHTPPPPPKIGVEQRVKGSTRFIPSANI
jgi:hypothetical protein